MAGLIPGGARRRGSCLWMMVGLGVAIPSFLSAAPPHLPQPPEPRSRSEVEAVLAVAAGVGVAVPAQPMNIVLLDDVKDHGKEAHDYPLWQERWARLLGGSAAWGPGPVNLYGTSTSSGVEAQPGVPGVKVLKAHAWPSPEQFAAADVIVAFCYLKWDAQRLEQVRQYLGRGKGLVVIHAATWTKPKPSSDVAAVLGVGGFRFYRHGLARISLADPAQELCRGLPREFDLEDETYWPPTPEPALPGYAVLATDPERVNPGVDEIQPQVMFWTCQPAGGRVFGCVPGHFTWTFDEPYFRILLLRGIAWAGASSPYRLDSAVLRGARVQDR